MPYVNNEPDQIEIRKLQNTLTAVGSGTIVLSLWMLLRTLVLLFGLRAETIAALRRLGGADGLTDKLLLGIITVIIVFVLLIVIAVRSYVGLSAIAEGRGRRRRGLYLAVAAMMIIINAVSVINDLDFTATHEDLGALSNQPSLSALIHIFAGAISILRSMESRRNGGPWKLRIAYGIMNLLLAAAVVLCTVHDRQWIITAIYGAGLVYTGVLRIVSAFRRTDIVFIQ